MAEKVKQSDVSLNETPSVVPVKEDKKPKPEPKGIKKVLKSRYFIFGVSVFLFIMSVFFLFLIDEDNFVRKAFGIGTIPFFTNLGKIVGGGKTFNVGIISWFILGIFWGLFFVIFSLIFMRKPVLESANKRHEKTHNGASLEARDIKKVNSIFFIVVFVISAAVLAMFFIFFPYKELNWKTALDPLLNVFLSMALFLLILLAIPVAVLVFILICKLVVWLISLIVGNVSKNVMSSEAYQESLAATTMAAERLKVEANNGMPAADKEEAKGRIDCIRQDGIVFPGLMAIDKQYEAGNAKGGEEPVNLSNLAERFQAYLCNKKKLYFDIELLRSYIAGLSASRLIILQGLSGTGKSSLPREFANFAGGSTTFYPVQATWRDRTDLLGYFSDFTGDYKETELLKNLYLASYNPEKINLFVLDEANISRVEYYFADFLSVYEYPSEDWKIPLVQVKEGMVIPKRIVDGKIQLPLNGWFFATINVDDSTFSISDKVYDRGMVLEFSELNESFTSKYNDKPLNISYSQLMKAFDEAANRKEYNLTKDEITKFLSVCDFVSNTFEVKFGNRIFNQIKRFVPVFVAMGGTKERALDIMFANKILRKVDGLYESYVEQGLIDLSKVLEKTYGKNAFPEAQRMIVRFRKKFF